MNISTKTPRAGRSGGWRTLAVASVSALLLSFTSTSATPIEGEIHFWGTFEPTGGTGLGDATGLDFGDPAYVASVSGDYSGLVEFSDTASFTDFVFDPLTPSPVNPLWETHTGDWSFRLESIVVDYHSSTQLNLSGQGTLFGPTGYDPTPGSWNFQGGGDASFSFRADNSATAAVPEGSSTMVLLGVGVFALLGFRRFTNLVRQGA